MTPKPILTPEHAREILARIDGYNLVMVDGRYYTRAELLEMAGVA